jgi:hypothetical protein
MKQINKIFSIINIVLALTCLTLGIVDLIQSGNSFGYYVFIYLSVITINKILSIK